MDQEPDTGFAGACTVDMHLHTSHLYRNSQVKRPMNTYFPGAYAIDMRPHKSHFIRKFTG